MGTKPIDLRPDRDLARSFWDDCLASFGSAAGLPVLTIHPDEQRGVLCLHLDYVEPARSAKNEPPRWGIVRTWPNSYNRGLQAEMLALIHDLSRMIVASLGEGN